MSEFGLFLDGSLAWLWTNKFGLIGWIIAISAFVLVPFRRPPAEARGWLLIFFALPWFALIVYGLIGRPNYAKERQKRLQALPAVFEGIEAKTRLCSSELVPDLTEDNLSLARLARGLGQFSAVSGNRIELLGNYHHALDRIVDDIDSAKRHVHLEFYIFANDAVGDRIMAALERASARGVSCRVLVDALGSYGSIRAIKRRLRPCGIEVRDILPLRRRWTSSRVDLRNHRKVILIDGHAAYTGSQNIWDPSAHTPHGNQELLVRCQGPVTAQLQTIFIADWYLESLEVLDDESLFDWAASSDDFVGQIVASGPDKPEVGVDLVFAHVMHNAAKEVTIVTPYFIPNDALLAAIESALIRGIRVRLITSEKSDHMLVGLAQRSYYAELLKWGVEIHLFGPDFLHAKHFRVDHEVCVIGSSNVDVRSFELNAEVDLICYGMAITTGLEALEQGYLARSSQLFLDDWQQRSLAQKIMENSARLLGDLI